jgi:hypothetical protein
MDTSPRRVTVLQRSLAALLAVLLVASWGASFDRAEATAGVAALASVVNEPTTTSVDPVAQQEVAPSFVDVKTGSAHAAAISLVTEAGIARGCGPQRFCPDASLTRAQMASLLAQAFGLQAVSTSRFTDVPRSSTHHGNINAIAVAGATQGCQATKFCPDRQVTREQVASLLVRMLSLKPTGQHPGFQDLTGSVHQSAVQALADAGMVKGCAPQRFCGDQSITRAQFATLLVQAGENHADFFLAARKTARKPSPPAATSPTEPIATTEPVKTEEPVKTQEPVKTEEPVKTTEPSPSDSSESLVGPVAGASRLFYSDADVVRYQSSMAKPGPYFVTGDAGHGGVYSPGDGARSVQLTKEFLADPKASYWNQSVLPYSPSSAHPLGMHLVRPMHAGWVYMTQPNHPNRDALARELKALLLAHATNPTLDFSNSTKYPVNYPGYAPSPIFWDGPQMTRLIKTRDMLGREAFTAAENETFDRWIYGYANWTAKWLHLEAVGRYLPGRLTRDYSIVKRPADAHRKSYDGGPLIGSMAMTYTNRHAAPAAAMSLAANYLKHYGYTGSTVSNPAYGRFTVDELLHHSRLFVEETLRFSVYPQGLQGDFERGDAAYHPKATARQGWLYSINVLANLVEMADYHAKRGDMSLWNYGTTAGYDGTAGVPIAGGFTQKSLHFYAWSMSRYMNDGWKRTNRGEPMVLSHFYHDVIPAATTHRYAPNDTLLEAAWKRSGQGFPAYGQHPQSQGPWHAHYGEGAKMVGLIEYARAAPINR